MKAISAWASGKAFQIAEGRLKEWLDIPNFESFVSNEIRDISGKLDVLIQAPFKQALMYLSEGNLDKCQEKVIEAISLDELDLPAILLYCDLLRLKKQYTLALDYYLQVIEKFGLRDDVAPPPLIEAYRKKVFETNILTGNSNFELGVTDNYYPVEVWCSEGGIVIRWEQQNASVFDRIIDFLFRGGRPKIVIYNWRGGQILEVSDSKISIAAVTSTLVVMLQGDEYRVYKFKDGTRLPTKLSRIRMEALFQPSKDIQVSAKSYWWKPQDQMQFSGANLMRKHYYYETVSRETVPAPYGRKMKTETRIEHRGGHVSVSFS